MHAPRVTTSARARVGLFGLFGCGNLGNDGSLEAMLSALRRSRPELELVCICADPKKVRETFDVAALQMTIGRLPQPLDALDFLLLRLPRHFVNGVRAIVHARRLGVLLIPGTGILDDFGTGPTGMPLTLFGWCLAARLVGARIGLVSIGAGPIRNRLSRWLMYAAARLADFRSYRDTISKEYMRKIGLDVDDDEVFPDLTFALATPPSAPQVEHEGQTTIGVGVMNYRGWGRDMRDGEEIFAVYIQKMAQFVTWLLDAGYRVRLLTGDTIDGAAVDKLARLVADARPCLPSGRLVTDRANSLGDLMSQMAETQIVVATRFHNIVCALKLAKPTASIGYAQKNDALMAEMGLAPFCQNIEDFSVDRLITQFQGLVAGAEGYAATVARVTAIHAADLKVQEALLNSRLFR